jgi:hypothetical protein
VPGPEIYFTREGFKVRRLQPAIGAEISGVDLRSDLTSAVVRDLRNALSIRSSPDRSFGLLWVVGRRRELGRKPTLWRTAGAVLTIRTA